MADIEKFVYYDNGRNKVLKPTDRFVIGSGGLAFEGATSNDFETELAVTDPTADRTITFPDEDGDVALLQSGSLPSPSSIPVKNPSTTTALTKGQVVYISGHSGNKPEVSLARSDSASTMPAFGFVTADIAAEDEGYVTTSGLIKGIATNAYSLGDTLYVSSTTAGSVQNSSPTGSNLIQNIGKVVRIDASNGEIMVGGAGRTNATPNLNEGKFFIGNASNQSSISTYTLPTSDGSANQILTTDGNGSVTFATVDPTEYSGFTTNRVIHANASGVLTASDFLKVDDTNNRLGIGTLTPLSTVEIVGNSADLAQMVVRQHNNNADGPDVSFKKSRGTESSPTAVAANDALTRINSLAYNGTSYVDSGYYGWYAQDASGNSTFSMTTRVSDTIAERWGIDSTGKVKHNNAYTFPTSDGTSGQVLSTDGSGALSFSTISSGSSTLSGLNDVNTSGVEDGNVLTYDSNSSEWNVSALEHSSFLYSSVSSGGQSTKSISAPANKYIGAYYRVSSSTGYPFTLNIFSANDVPDGFLLTVFAGPVFNDTVTVSFSSSSSVIFQDGSSGSTYTMSAGNKGYTRSFIAVNTVASGGWYEVFENTFDNSNDVNFSSLTDKDLIYYDNSTSKWKNDSITDLVKSSATTGFTLTTSSTLTAALGESYVIVTNTNACTITLPSTSSSDAGRILTIKVLGTNGATIDVDSGNEYIDGSSADRSLSDGDCLTLMARGAFSQWYIIGKVSSI